MLPPPTVTQAISGDTSANAPAIADFGAIAMTPSTDCWHNQSTASSTDRRSR